MLSGKENFDLVRRRSRPAREERTVSGGRGFGESWDES